MATAADRLRTALHTTARVQPGNKIEITAPELREGEDVDVFLIPRTSETHAGRSVLEFLDSLPPGPRSAADLAGGRATVPGGTERMGSLTLPSTGPVYADAQIFIYSVEKHPIYAPLLRPLWASVARGDLEVVSSELTLMETLVGPLKTGNSALKLDYENIFLCSGIRLIPITQSILHEGAQLLRDLEQFADTRRPSCRLRPFLRLHACAHE